MKFALVTRRPMSGLGQDNCPSMEQLAGIVDPSDPCQAANITSGAAPVSTSIAPALTPPSQTCLPQGSMGPLAPGQVWCATGTGAPATGLGQGVTTQMYVGLAMAAGFLILMSFVGGGRR